MTKYITAWGFVLAVTALDVGFAWAHRESFLEWEMNPLAAQAAARVGLPAVLAFRGGSVVAGGVVVGLARRRVRAVGTAVAVAAHLALLFIYARGYLA